MLRRLLVPVLVTGLIMSAAVAPVSASSPTGKNVQLPLVSAGGGFTVSGAAKDTHGNDVAGGLAGVCTAVDDCFLAAATTAADGTFSIPGVPAGSYLLKVYPAEGQNLLPTWYPGATGGSVDPAGAVSVVVGGDVSGLEVDLVDGYRITGHVRTPGGDPVEGVSIVSSGTGSGIPSDATGFYQVVGLAPGTVELLVRGPDSGPFARQIPNGTVIDGVQVPEGGEPGTFYDTSSGDLTGQDITIVVGRTISGHVTGAAGLPVAVTASGANPSFEGLVDGSGNFMVTGLYPGSDHLIFAFPDSNGASSEWPFGYYAGQAAPLTADWGAAATVDTTAGNVAGIEAVMPVRPSISGTVADVHGPVAGASVTICGGSESGCGRVLSDASGAFRVRNVPADTFTVQAGAPHHVVVAWSGGRSNPNPFATGPLVVGSKSVTGLSIVLPLGSSISGTVTGPGGVPLAGVLVFAAPQAGGIWESGPGGAFSNAQGKYTITGLANGKYTLSFSPPEGSPYASGYLGGSGYTSSYAQATVLTLTDGTDPVVTAPSLRFLVGKQVRGTRVPIGLRWSAADPGSNIKANRLQRQVNGGKWATVISPVTPDVIGSVSANRSTYRFRSRATDFTGNTSSDKAGPTVKPVIAQQTATGTAYRKSWSTVSNASAAGGSYRRTSTAGATVTYRFTGRGIAWVATTGPGFGKASVSIDGGAAVTVDLGSAAMFQRIVYGRTFSSAATHTIRIRNLATVGRPRIDVDAFVVLK